MKTFYNVPKSDGEQSFYRRYASLIPSLEKMGYLAQIVSALTEFGIIYAVILSSLSPLWPVAAPRVALFGAIVGTLFLELGLRKLLPYSTRAVIHKRWGGWDGWISGFVIVATFALLITSGLLSFGGSHYLVEAVAPPPVVVSNLAADSTRAAQITTTRDRFGELIDATTQKASSQLIALDADLTELIEREARTGKRYTTKKGQIRKQIERTKSERENRISELRTQQAEALAAIEQQHTIMTNEVASTNQQAEVTAAALVDSYGGNLGYFTIICLFAFTVAVTVKELHHAGAGIEEQVQPDAFAFEEGPLRAFINAITAKIKHWVYGKIYTIEEATGEAPEPVEAAAVYERSTGGLSVVKGAGRKRKKAATAPAAIERRSIGFGKNDTSPTDQSNVIASNASTQCVEDASKQGNCEQCGTAYTKRTTWQKFCTEQCRKDHHAAKHGKEYEPVYKPWKNG